MKVDHTDARRGYDLWAETYDRTDNPLVALDRRHTLDLLDPQPGQRILDAGCGTGYYLSRIDHAGALPLGLDFSSGMLKVARRRLPRMPLIQTDLDAVLPVGPRRFDAVLCALVSEHLTNLPLTFAEFSRVLRPGGRLVFSAFHPELAAAGIEANFESEGVEHRLGAEPHTVDDYLNRISGSGFRIRSQQVFRGDSELVREIGWAEKYRGRPLLLLIDATSDSGH